MQLLYKKKKNFKMGLRKIHFQFLAKCVLNFRRVFLSVHH